MPHASPTEDSVPNPNQRNCQKEDKALGELNNDCLSGNILDILGAFEPQKDIVIPSSPQKAYERVQ